ncbi:unnamed protein product, partial [marine sediment metagenome]
MAYDKLSIQDFGQGLLHSNDLDPVYVALYGLINNHRWDKDQLKRWLVAYWCFYNCGFASYISEFIGEQFWEEMWIA